jgi:isoleucyl-tRNA synthetase
MFKVKDTSSLPFKTEIDGDCYFLAWTTTPWTLPSNTALCVGPNITYVLADTFNPYTGKQIKVILAKDLVNTYFNPKNENLSFENYQPGDKSIPYRVLGECKGSELVGIRYEQLIPWVNPGENVFVLLRVILFQRKKEQELFTLLQHLVPMMIGLQNKTIFRL